ncbi:hypothetical protein D3C85_150560 [compost metagenome]|jgi:hypothetical protein
MALFVNQKDDRSELQKRIAAELQEKAKKKALGETKRPDGVLDSQYLKDTKTTTSLAWVWVLIGIATVAVTIYLIMQSSY